MAKNKRKRTLIIRFSSLGDVAMTIPVVYSVAKRYPDEEFVLLTKEAFQAVFINKPNNLVIENPKKTVMADLIRHPMLIVKQQLTDILGWRVKPAMTVVVVVVVDLHAVLRSWKLDLKFLLRGAKIAVIHKGKCAKRALTRRHNKQFKPLTSSIERYQQVFERLGYDATIDFKSLFPEKNPHEGTWIGIAPFAKHAGKIYPLEKMEEVIRELSLLPQVKLFLFGGKNDCEKLEKWATLYEQVQVVAGNLTFPEELELMNDLDVAVSMDSANMHLASLVNTPVVSIWGATHPYAGFYGYNQNPDNAVQVDLPCRPCSVFGNKSCWRGDYACLKAICPEMIVKKLRQYIR
ncbi:glycosyl transferase family 1 [Bacteroidia bacterium]|nr:glycosyl transferase family 1 [Bacteroidia bacterium]